MDGMLSQEEINALLSGMDTTATDTGDGQGRTLTDAEKDAVGEISNISMGTAATTLFSLVNQKVTITTPRVSYATWDDLASSYDRPCVFIQISYREGLDGNNVLILKESDVKIITDLMMGGDGTNVSDELSELHLSAISEAMNQMMGSAATSLSSMLSKKVDISPPAASLIDMNDAIEGEDLADFLKGDFVKVAFKMEIGDLVDSELMQLYPFEFAKDLFSMFSSDNSSSKQPSKTETPKPSAPAPAQQQPMQGMPQGMPMQGMPQGMPMQGMPMDMSQMGMQFQGQMPYGYGMPMQDINIQPAQFQNFAPMFQPLNQQENIDLIMDVPLEVTVELGRTNKSIKEILEISPGTIIELNKIAGEPIDVLVNGKFVAKGEVVVIEESFGIRVTEIIR